jgi:hypothetical protein
MKIDTQNIYFRSPAVAPRAPQQPQATPELSAQEKLRQALEDKRWLTESIQTEPPAGEPVLGQLLDLRV